MQCCMLHCHCRWTTSSSRCPQTSHLSSCVMSPVSPKSDSEQTFTSWMWSTTSVLFSKNTGAFLRFAAPLYSATVPRLLDYWWATVLNWCVNMWSLNSTQICFTSKRPHNVFDNQHGAWGPWGVRWISRRLWSKRRAAVRCCDWERGRMQHSATMY